MLILTILLCSFGYTFPESPYYYDYNFIVIDGSIGFGNPENILTEYHFCGYDNNQIELYGSGTVEIYHRGTLYDRVEVPEPASLILLGSGLWSVHQKRKTSF